ncbi:MAG: hypothetical protein J0I15_03780 [Herbaspirillum huttiense]|uniref:hypothetical protein n=1 Tax=Herbaspirillum huttiense TaxID=863372 RepID=UPI001AC9D749|nr:hypothetical protein [Herbaspirillum huttiense]MBN9355549.1 hypothetical protein [Herbaspirillum huttiense]
MPTTANTGHHRPYDKSAAIGFKSAYPSPYPVSKSGTNFSDQSEKCLPITPQTSPSDFLRNVYTQKVVEGKNENSPFCSCSGNGMVCKSATGNEFTDLFDRWNQSQQILKPEGISEK